MAIEVVDELIDAHMLWLQKCAGGRRAHRHEQMDASATTRDIGSLSPLWLVPRDDSMTESDIRGHILDSGKPVL